MNYMDRFRERGGGGCNTFRINITEEKNIMFRELAILMIKNIQLSTKPSCMKMLHERYKNQSN